MLIEEKSFLLPNTVKVLSKLKCLKKIKYFTDCVFKPQTFGIDSSLYEILISEAVLPCQIVRVVIVNLKMLKS